MSELYFPLSGLLSMVVRVTESAAVEVAAVGNEGFVGAPAFLGAERSATEVVVQIPGEALQVPVDAVSAQAGRLLERYIAALMTQMSQSTACNYLPRSDNACAAGSSPRTTASKADELELTQEFLAQMLAVRRPTVSEVAGVLQEAGIIEYHRGRIRILDRASRAGGLRVLRDRTPSSTASSPADPFGALAARTKLSPSAINRRAASSRG